MIAVALGLRPETWRKWVAATTRRPPCSKKPRGRKPAIPDGIREILRAQYLKKYKQWGPAILAAWAQRCGLGKWSATTVARAIEDLKDPPVKRILPKRLRLTAPGVLWSEDGAGFRQGNSKHELLAVQDDFSRYTVNSKLASGPASVDDVVLYLERAFAAYGAPLVLKHDGGKIFQNVQVQDLLARYQVESLTGPRHYPQYNGRRERAFRDLRSFEQALRRHDPLLPLSVRLEIAISDLNEERPQARSSGPHCSRGLPRPTITLGPQSLQTGGGVDTQETAGIRPVPRRAGICSTARHRGGTIVKRLPGNQGGNANRFPSPKRELISGRYTDTKPLIRGAGRFQEARVVAKDAGRVEGRELATTCVNCGGLRSCPLRGRG